MTPPVVFAPSPSTCRRQQKGSSENLNRVTCQVKLGLLDSFPLYLDALQTLTSGWSGPRELTVLPLGPHLLPALPSTLCSRDTRLFIRSSGHQTCACSGPLQWLFPELSTNVLPCSQTAETSFPLSPVTEAACSKRPALATCAESPPL